MEKILEVKHLKKYFPIKKNIFSRSRQAVKAVDDISFDLFKDETLGLVGESGSGKSTVGRTILRLLDATDGEVRYRGEDVLHPASEKRGQELRQKMQMIFQDPYASLNPRMIIGDALMEPMQAHGLCSRQEAEERAMQLLQDVGLDKDYFYRFPHQFSGGQRQRIGIARALALKPEIIVCDEPVSALDVSVQAQIINLFKDLQDEMGLTYLFIAHDLSVVKYLSTRIAVMYLGELVEVADKTTIFENPMHPYTQALMSAIPKPDPRLERNRIILTGDVPNPADPPKGCKFHNRCHRKMDICDKVHPELRDLGGHCVRCHLYGEQGGTK